MEFFQEWVKLDKKDKNNLMLRYIKQKWSLEDVVDTSEKEIKLQISRFSAKLTEKWNSCRFDKKRMLEKNKTWLEGADLEFKVAFHRPQASTSASLKLHPGRPPIDFENASEKTKKRRVE